MSEVLSPSLLTRPDTNRILAGLKPFQRQSVDYVFRQLYGSSPTRRFLLADEVGLGKTMVARGVIAKAIDHLWDTLGRIDIVYICSNHDIARQNINRLNITGKKDFALASRITLLPITLRSGSDGEPRSLRDQKLNFVSFTPGTSFDLKSSLGVSTERALLYHLLAEHWNLSGAAPCNVLQGASLAENFRRQVHRFPSDTIDESMRRQFLHELDKHPGLKKEFFDLCECFHRSDAKVADDVARRRNALVGGLRTTLARACLHALEPDLIILDEFQRFKHLLVDDPDSEASQLAHDLFRYSDDHAQARVLLLSATPYKMYTMGHESAEDDHYADFLGTLRFLLADAVQTRRVEELLKEYRRLLYRVGQAEAEALGEVKAQLEATLRSVMCRTERLAVTADRSGMLREMPSKPQLAVQDVRAYVDLQKIARALDHHNTVEYWKSAPYLLNFMEDYALKQGLKRRCNQPQVVEAFKSVTKEDGILLPWSKLQGYAPIDAQNPRLRQLIHDTIECGAWQALWMPPSLPYYTLTGAFAQLQDRRFTKRLVFSSWKVVPKTAATLVSYEAERRMITSFSPQAENTPENRRAMRQLLNFARSNNRLTGMPVLGLLYPSFFLAQQFDPLNYMCNQPAGTRPDAGELVNQVARSLTETLQPLLREAPQTGPEDESWYWAAPILLDHLDAPQTSQAWWADETLASRWRGVDEEVDEIEDATDSETAGSPQDVGWRQHVEEARRLLATYKDVLGRPPGDLAEVLARMAVAGPAVTALRAISRVSGGLDFAADPLRRWTAGKIAFGFRALFNAPEVMALIRGQNRAEPYWQRVLDYSLAGCIQAMLDEYTHVLRESLGDAQAEPAKLITDLGHAVSGALELHVANPGADRIGLDETGTCLNFENQRLRAWFAMRFGDEKDESGKTVSRADQVRSAFNSPFWPFVLITTSVGQEGLDFHTYCHAVMHWNLPANPVDMEQREGRVHRYKGHAVRRNVASEHAAALTGAVANQSDPWCTLFAAAADHCDDTSGMTPYWVYQIENGAVIERHVPALPFSSESDHLPALRNSLAVYRMVFGQPRQDDLVEFLLQRVSPEWLVSQMDQLQINLTPAIEANA